MRAQDLLLRFWRDLHERGVPHCVVGDTARLPYDVQSDIDMVVAPADLARVNELVLEFCENHGLTLVQRLVHEQTAVYLVLAWLEEDGATGFLALDFCSDYRRAGRHLLSAGEMLHSRSWSVDGNGATRGFYVAAPAMEFIYYLIKKIDKGQLDPRHGEHLTRQWRADPEGAGAQVKRFWRQGDLQALVCEAAQSGDWSRVCGALPRLRRALRRRCRRGAGDHFGELRRWLHRWRHPTGLVIAVLGADGSGKSAVIEQLRSDWAPAFRQLRYRHLRPRLFSRAAANCSTVSDPHGRAARGALTSSVKLVWFVLDYLLGYGLRIRPWLARSTLVIFDRYFDDLYLDPQRYRFGAPVRWVWRAAQWLPRPQRWLVLDADVAALQARKQEVSAAGSARQQAAYRAFCSQERDCVRIDANPPLPQVRAQVNQVMLTTLSARALDSLRRAAWSRADNPAGSRWLLRFCRWNLPVLSRLVRMLFNSDIYCALPWPPSLPHPYGVIIHSQARLGRGVTVMQQVTIGGKHGSDRAPQIGDRVYIGAGAKVLGGIAVGHDAVIGANAVVTRDVPPGATVVGANRQLPKGHGEHQCAASESAGGARPLEEIDVPGAISMREGT